MQFIQNEVPAFENLALTAYILVHFTGHLHGVPEGYELQKKRDDFAQLYDDAVSYRLWRRRACQPGAIGPVRDRRRDRVICGEHRGDNGFFEDTCRSVLDRGGGL